MDTVIGLPPGVEFFLGATQAPRKLHIGVLNGYRVDEAELYAAPVSPGIEGTARDSGIRFSIPIRRETATRMGGTQRNPSSPWDR